MKAKVLPLSLSGIKFDAPNGRTFSGYASVFGGIDAYGDRIERGAYSETLENRTRDVKMRWNHFGPVIGKWTRMIEDEKGLYVEGELTPNHSVASDVAASMQHGAVDGLSIGFMIKEEEMDGPIRVLKKIDLIEVSVVEEPADNSARIEGIKNMLHNAENLKDVETALRDACRFSRADATALVSCIKSLSHGERDGNPEASKLSESVRSLVNKW